MRYAVGVGSNRGDRRAIIDQAAELVRADGLVRVQARSGLLENPAVGGPPGQGPFLNGAWVVETGLGPHQLLLALMRVEAALGRCRTVLWGPRTIDLDLLLAEDTAVIDNRLLQLPHPRLHQRPFVYLPLAEVAGDWRHPKLGCRVAELAARAAEESSRDRGSRTEHRHRRRDRRR